MYGLQYNYYVFDDTEGTVWVYLGGGEPPYRICELDDPNDPVDNKIPITEEEFFLEIL